ncbi:MAG TPA: NrfD/PsrC family molybdoenzyme membrane anchor subunit, partial [Dehalococcoidia bacterium]|nr:NrfD/PsrC family molybdoenzyme membrane anchor subunit [Dehalococcoidia bacterium]
MTTNVSSYRERLERIALAPTIRTHWSYNLFMVAMSLIVLWGLFAWYTQLRHGLKVTGLNDMVPWGIYMTNFVFFIGISYAGTLLSGILRITQAGWRTPVTRMAEIITVVGLIVGSVQIVFDNGRPDRLLNMIIYGRFQSAFVWDMLSITTYLTGAIIYLYVPLIPD